MDLRRSAFASKNLFNNDTVSQVIAYEDESVELFFKDGSNLQLSPCGANFKYTRLQCGYVPSLGKRQFELIQRCQFATSETHEKVILALTIRNQLCSRPYILSKFLIDMKLEPVRGFKEIVDNEWPVNTDSVKICDDGGTMVYSKDGYALLHLHKGGHKVEVYYNAVVSDNSARAPISKAKDNSDVKTIKKHLFVVQCRIFPATSCPLEWQWPLQLAKKAICGDEFSMDKLSNVTLLPHSVPVKCRNQFRHVWRNIEPHLIDSDLSSFQGEVPEFADSSIKFLWCEGHLYWIRKDKEFPKIETWLSNGDIFKSHPKNERYFIHMQAQPVNICASKQKFTERIVSAAFIPHDSTLKSVMLRCIRMISYKSQSSSSVKSPNPCWEVASASMRNITSETESELPSIKASVKIPDVGVFSAVADSIEISFDDGAMLHMTVSVSENGSSGWDFSCGQCRIVLSDGKYFVTDDLNCGTIKVQNYMSHVRAWIEWLSLPKLHRIEHPFYSGTMYDQNEMKRVTLELEKIRNATTKEEKYTISDATESFQYLELAGSPKPRTYKIGCDSLNDVSHALSHTSKAIGDIDAMIASLRNSGA